MKKKILSTMFVIVALTCFIAMPAFAWIKPQTIKPADPIELPNECYICE